MMGSDPVTDEEDLRNTVDVKIGFTHSPRELVINSTDNQDDVAGQVKQAINSEEGVLELVDSKGARFIVNTSEISHVEIGTSTARTVGFAG